MIKVSLNTIWKIAVLILLIGILYYVVRIETNTNNSKYYTPIGCGTYNAQSGTATSNLCLQPQQPVQSQTTK